MTLETTATTLDEDVIAAEPGGGDVVEGATDRPDIASITVGAAASEYFEWCEEREAQREKRAQRRSNGGAPAARSKKAALPFDKAARVSVTRFVSHCSPHLPISELTPHGMASFQETIGSNATDVGARLHPVKEFLRFCWKTRNYTDVNLGNHLRVKRVSEGAAGASLEHEAAERFEMTADGLEHLKVDLERLQQGDARGDPGRRTGPRGQRHSRERAARGSPRASGAAEVADRRDRIPDWARGRQRGPRDRSRASRQPRCGSSCSIRLMSGSRNTLWSARPRSTRRNAGSRLRVRSVRASSTRRSARWSRSKRHAARCVTAWSLSKDEQTALPVRRHAVLRGYAPVS